MADETQQALVKRQPVPRELAALGVSIAQDAESHMQLVVIPDAVRQRMNVLMPVQAFQQADPHWTPSVRVVQLDPSKDGAHFYKQGSGKVAPRKQGLELLADAAGVISTQVTLLKDSRERLEVGGVMAEQFTHHAVLRIRKSDGTLRTIEGSKTYEPYAEYEEIKDAVMTARNPYWRESKGNLSNEEADAREIKKRWLAEIKNSKAKNESKATLRAIRSALQIPHTFTEAEVKKPFVVIGWNFTPPDDAETRAAIAGTVASLYGGHQVQETHMLEPAPAAPAATESVPEPEQEPEPSQADDEPEWPGREHTAGCALDPDHEGDCKDAEGRFLDPDGPQAGEEVPEPDPGPLADDEPEEVEPESVEHPPEPAADEVGEGTANEGGQFSPPAGSTSEVELANAAAEMIPPKGMFAEGGSATMQREGQAGYTLKEILDYGDAKDPERGRGWFQWALAHWGDKTEPFYLALQAFVAVYAPDLLES